MDAAVARVANLAKYGDNNRKEARGLQLLSRAIEADGRLTLHKSFEGARADFCVFRPGLPALGIQLKTTGVNGVDGRRTGNGSYNFHKTDGYAGLLLVFMAIHVQPPRIWLAEGSNVVSTDVKIPVKRVKRERRSYQVQEEELATVASLIYAIYMEATSGSNTYVLLSPEDHEKPTAPTALAEYDAFKRLQRSLPVVFIDPPAEQMSFDYVVDGRKWQLKLARYEDKKDRYNVACHKSAGKVGGKYTYRQYEADDFDFLCIQLPEDTMDCCYLIPQGILAERGLVGNATRFDGKVHVYPHRRVAAWKSVQTAGVHWTESFRIDFAHDPLTKLAHIVGG